MKNHISKIIVVLGPTASGKTKLATTLAREFNGEIISVDSRQIYKNMDIGTGKDLKEYNKIPYHLINITTPNQTFNVAEFQFLAYQAINKILKKKKLPILVGGSGLYLEAILNNYQFTPNPNFLNPPILPNYQFLLLGIQTEKTILHQKINARVDKMIKQGLIIETKKLLKKYGTASAPLQTIGYKEIINHLTNKIPLDKTTSLIKLHTRQFAKRQMTWFRGMSKRNPHNKIKWINSYKQAQKLVKKSLYP